MIRCITRSLVLLQTGGKAGGGSCFAHLDVAQETPLFPTIIDSAFRRYFIPNALSMVQISSNRG